MTPRTSRLLRFFVTGLLAALPLAATLAVVVWVLRLLHEWLGPGSLVGRQLVRLGLDVVESERLSWLIGLGIVVGAIYLLGLLVQAWGATQVAWALLAAHVTSRFMPLLVIATLEHVGDTPTSKSKPLADRIDASGLAVALLWWLAAVLLAGSTAPDLQWLPAVLGAALGLAWVWGLLQRRLGGFTGDGLGATQQASELGFYLGLALAA